MEGGRNLDEAFIEITSQSTSSLHSVVCFLSSVNTVGKEIMSMFLTGPGSWLELSHLITGV